MDFHIDTLWVQLDIGQDIDMCIMVVDVNAYAYENKPVKCCGCKNYQHDTVVINIMFRHFYLYRDKKIGNRKKLHEATSIFVL